MIVPGVGLDRAVVDAILKHRADDPHGDHPIGMIRLSYDAYVDCITMTRPLTGPAAAFGTVVVHDPDLPPGVWRLCTAGGDLIRDSRSPNPGTRP